MTDHMRIGELAKRAGVTPRTIRYYEDLGLLGVPEREDSGFRYYNEEALTRLKKIEFLKKINFSLDEIASVIPLYFSEPNGVQAKQKIVDIMQQHLKEADTKIEALQQFRAELLTDLDRVKSLIKGANKE